MQPLLKNSPGEADAPAPIWGQAEAAGKVVSERDFCEERLSARAEQLASTAIRIAVMYYLLATLLLPFVIESSLFVRLSIVGHVAAALGLLFSHHVVLKGALPHIAYALSQITFMTGLSAYVHWAHRLVPGSSDVTLYDTSYILLTVGFLLTWPLRLRGLIFAGASYASLGFFAYWPSPKFAVMTWLECATASLAVALGAYSLRRERAMAAIEYHNLQLAVGESKARVQRELELAREIQDSLAPNGDVAVDERTRVRFFQSRTDAVGGDWYALRTTPDGELVLVVADATGKGMQAALVVHAVQSLWAEALHEPTFDADAWIGRLNRTLLTLGERTPHSLTMGIAVIGPQKITYWSAGHWPLYLVRGSGKFEALNAVGNPIGIFPDETRTPRVAVLDAGEPCSVLLGTDGIFDMLPRNKARGVPLLLSSLESKGEGAFEEFRLTDDATLILWTRRS